MSYSIFLILIVIVALLLILIIMVQNPKGGGLSATFGGGSQLGGVQSTNKFLDNATWTLAISLFVLILASNIAIPREKTNPDTILQEKINDVEITKPEPTAPTAEAPVSESAE